MLASLLARAENALPFGRIELLISSGLGGDRAGV